MARNKARVWNDGLKTEKTESNPKGGGRVRGRDYSYLSTYPGSIAKHRLSYCRMKAQAKFRNEPWEITWEQYQELWEGKWHLRGTHKGSYALNRIDWEGPWNLSNVAIDTRDSHWRRQRQAQINKKHKKDNV